MKVLQYQNNHSRAWYYLGLTEERLGKKEDALICYKKALQYDSEFKEAQEKVNQTGGAVTNLDIIRFMQSIEKTEDKTEYVSQSQPVDRDIPKKTNILEQGKNYAGNLLYTGRRRFFSFSKSLLFFIIGLFASVYIYGAVYIPIVDYDYDFEFYYPEGILIIIGITWPIWSLFLIFLYNRVTKYEIFEKRIDFYSGLLNRKIDSVWLYEIEDIDFSRPFLKQLTGDAIIHIVLSPQRGGTTTMKTPRKGKSISKTSGKEFQIIGLGNHRFMKKLFEEIRDSTLVERRDMKKWWI